jgi:hypothetical protein
MFSELWTGFYRCSLGLLIDIVCPQHFGQPWRRQYVVSTFCVRPHW